MKESFKVKTGVRQDCDLSNSVPNSSGYVIKKTNPKGILGFHNQT